MIHHYQLRAAMEAYLAQLKATGEPMDLAQVVPPPLPPDRNSAPLFWRAAALLDTNYDVLSSNPPPAMQAVAPGKAMVAWRQPFILNNGSSNSWQDIGEVLARESEALELLNELTNGAAFDFHLHYARHYEMQESNLAPEKEAVQLLSASAIYNLHAGDTALAVSNVQTMLVLVTGRDDDRTVISQIVRIAMVEMVFPATWEILQTTNVTDAQLAMLQNDWAQPEFTRVFERTLPVEREYTLAAVSQWRKSNSELGDYFEREKVYREVMEHRKAGDTFLGGMEIRAKFFLWHYWWSYADELRYLKGTEVLEATLHQAETNGSFLAALDRQKAALDQLGISKLTNSVESPIFGPGGFHATLSSSVLTFGLFVKTIMKTEAERQIVMSAIALKRYQLAHGQYPASLHSLVPEFLSKVPTDPVDGRPLRYHLRPDGTYLLYSIGENGVDDGGRVVRQQGATSHDIYWDDPGVLDWVWPQPATPAEVQKYYARQSGNSKS